MEARGGSGGGAGVRPAGTQTSGGSPAPLVPPPVADAFFEELRQWAATPPPDAASACGVTIEDIGSGSRPQRRRMPDRTIDDHLPQDAGAARLDATATRARERYESLLADGIRAEVMKLWEAHERAIRAILAREKPPLTGMGAMAEAVVAAREEADDRHADRIKTLEKRVAALEPEKGSDESDEDTADPREWVFECDVCHREYHTGLYHEEDRPEDLPVGWAEIRRNGRDVAHVCFRHGLYALWTQDPYVTADAWPV